MKTQRWSAPCTDCMILTADMHYEVQNLLSAQQDHRPLTLIPAIFLSISKYDVSRHLFSKVDSAIVKL